MSRGGCTRNFALILVCALSGIAQASDVLDRQAAAIGVFPERQILRLNGRITEASYSGDFTWQTMRPGMVRVTLALGPDQVFEEGFDGATAWEKPIGAAKALVANDKAHEALRRGTMWLGHYRPLKELATMGLKVEELEPETLDGARYERIRVTFANGDATTLFLDPATALIARTRTVKALHAGIDPTKKPIETLLSDWRRVGPLMVAFKTVDRETETKRVLMTVEWTDARWVAGDASIFAMPQ